MTTQPLEQLIQQKFPHLTSREVDDCAQDVRNYCRLVMRDMERLSEEREPPHNLPTDSDSTLGK